ncbi:MAG: DMT family transporter [Desulforudis sp.]|nr:MAG: DMT family transporter [Desulforudis sp.]
MEHSQYKQVFADTALLFVAFVWGITFVVVKEALTDIGPYYFLAIRFAIAFLFLALICWRSFLRVNRSCLTGGLLIGLALFGGYAFQTVALQYTTAANTGFITGLSVVLVPVFAALITRTLPSPIMAVGVASATVGLGLVAIQGDLSFNYGDVLVFMCAVCFANHIILVGRYAPCFDPVMLAIIQIGTVGLISALIAPCVESFPLELTTSVQVALLATAIPATALAFLIQNWAQKFTSPTHTAIIFTMEPVFAGLAAWLWGGEDLGVRQWLGGALIVAGMLITVLKTTGCPATDDAKAKPTSHPSARTGESSAQ